MVRIKVINHDKPLTGAVQKVLSHIIILRSASDRQVMLTFADIESVTSSQLTTFRNFVTMFQKILHNFLKNASGKKPSQVKKIEIVPERKSFATEIR